jgi:hypothetical protein
LASGFFWIWDVRYANQIPDHTSINVKLDLLFYCDGIKITDQDATLTPYAVIFIYRFGSAFNQLVNIHRTYVCAFTIACALFLVHGYFPHLVVSSLPGQRIVSHNIYHYWAAEGIEIPLI